MCSCASGLTKVSQCHYASKAKKTSSKQQSKVPSQHFFFIQLVTPEGFKFSFSPHILFLQLSHICVLIGSLRVIYCFLKLTACSFFQQNEFLPSRLLSKAPVIYNFAINSIIHSLKKKKRAEHKVRYEEIQYMFDVNM